MKFSKAARCFHIFPFIVSAIGILVLPITYVHGETTDYSLGPKAYALYASIVIYLIMILYYCLRYWDRLDTEKYVDEKTSLFNQYSFETVLEEFKQYRQQGYRICENGVIFIGSSMEKAQTIVDRVKNVVEGKYGKENIIIEIKVLSGENTVTKHDCMRNAIAFCTETGSHFAYIDYLTHIYNRNAFERDLSNLQENSDGYYMIADLNDLKIVNDTIGHSAGDALLQGVAGLLFEAAGDDGKVYRQGGDEFAVLYYKDAQQFINELSKQCKIHNQSYSVPIKYAIGYCKLSDRNFMDVADKMMYANKRAMKQQKD